MDDTAEETLDFGPLLDPKTEDREIHQSIAKYCRIDLRNLDVALERHASLYAYAVACFEMAKVNEAKAKWDRESAESTGFQVAMDQNAKETVGGAEKRVKTYPSVIAAVKHYHEAMLVTARLKGLVSGLEHRRDMLVQISARQRAEMSM